MGLYHEFADFVYSSTYSMLFNEALGYTDTKNLTSTQLFRLLDEHYDLAFDVRAFQIARSK